MAQNLAETVRNIAHLFQEPIKPHAIRRASSADSIYSLRICEVSFEETLESLANLSLPDTNDQEQGIFELDTSLNKSLAPSRCERVHLESSYEEGGEERYVRRGRWEGVRGEYNRSIAMSAIE
ncbi:hypothetical protein GUITHDRAFT_114844 [Guillardia theta CCMP2712]|uniref:Uncharacterized protein n=1 Tax=Guillardia theta (strain CCMP2712) TaxID=905079 RepID=L1IST0_GUITC|nr:hypothetical protein GUITHDRAFT_114844 [Guillardia theta CCMP2712]EKX38964.1 hypothetical protein GUITHDRAFT_114844 [Guillardia theta CCMP2712]|eukprot:XP_005825944.1 hypothetical protein GUITHDRAFT_114844 [Guillardia theta CCMP2712]